MRFAHGLLLVLALSAACKRNDDISDDPETPKSKKKHVVDKKDKAFPEPKEHRSKHETCPSADTMAPTTTTFGPKMPIPEGPPCKSKADCKDEKNGRCSRGHCTYDGCYDDKDCGNKVCQCSEEGKRGYFCKAGDCSVDDDCGGGAYCSPSVSMSCGGFFGVVGYYCHTRDDECTNDDECVKGKEKGYCAFDPDQKHWRCGYGHCVG